MSDKTIKELVKAKKLAISPFDVSLVQPGSYNIRLGNLFRFFDVIQQPFLDVAKPVSDFTKELKVASGERIIIHPSEFVLGETMEYFAMPDDLVGQIVGRSSLGRIGINVATAGYIDPGYKGSLTFQISNLANIPIALYPGMKIGQIIFHFLSTPAQFPYGSKKLESKYQGQRGPTESRLFKEFVRTAKRIIKNK